MKSNPERGRLVIFSAPSGAGKTSIVKYILEHEPRLEFSVSATSRTPRRGERNGIDYYFMSADEFKRRIDNNEFIEWEEVYKDTFYGTLRSEPERIWSKNKHVIFDVDVIGGLNLKKEFGAKAASIFVKPPDIKELEKRLINRGTDSPSQIAARIARAEEEMQEAGHFDFIIINDELKKARHEALRFCSSFLNKEDIL